jgi:RHS repeat-associated protein
VAIVNAPAHLIRLAATLLVLMWIGSQLWVVQAQNAEFTQNTKNLNAVTLEVPLANYPGRGINLPITLRYSSQGLWRIGFINSVQINQFNQRNSVAEAIYGEYSTGGWKTSLDVPVIEWPRLNDLYKFSGVPYSQGYISGTTYRIARVFVHMPDGSTHELRRSDQIYANSVVEMNGEFYAVDGSRMRYSGNSDGTGTLYMSDGSRYIFSSGTVQFIDRNGNTLSYNVSNRQWTDTMGRVINMPWPANPGAGDYTYSLPGLGGSISYTLKFRSLSDVISSGSPSRVPIGDHYLPYPGSTPTYYGSNNFPQPTNTSCMFASANSDPEEPQNPSLNTIVVGRGQAGAEAFNPVVLAEIDFPNGQSYSFTYNNYGELDKVTYPTGGYQRYAYAPVAAVTGGGVVPYGAGSRGITSRWISPKGDGTDEAQWIYSATTNPSTVTAPNGTYSQTYFWIAQNQQSNNFGYQDARAGMPYDERIYDANNVLLRRTLTKYDQSSATNNRPSPGSGTYTAYRNPRPIRMVSLILDTGGDALSSAISTSYDTTYQFTVGPEPNSSSDFDYLSVAASTAQSGDIDTISNGSLVRTTTFTSLTSNSNYRSLNILGLPTSNIVYDAASNVVAQSSVTYDEQSLLTYSSVPGWSDAQTTYRGNPTTTSRWLNYPSSTWLSAHVQYDQCGSARKAWDARDTTLANPSLIDYSANYAFAYPTSTTSAVPDSSGAYGSTSAFTSSSVYDFNTGLVLSTTDANGQTTTFDYTDSLNRIRKVSRPDGGWTMTDYGDTVGNLYVRTRKLQDNPPGERTIEGYQYLDGLGRTVRIFAYENQDTSYPWLTVDTTYDSMGRAWKTSNPYRSTGPGSSINTSVNSVQTTFDALDRPTHVVTSVDSADVVTAYVGNIVTVTDPAGRKRRKVSDAFERVVRVDEPDKSSGNLDDGNGYPVQPTYYTYDVLGNLHKIDQGGQYRYFLYDSLGRLLRTRNPEQSAANDNLDLNDPLTDNTDWTIGYSYDNNGNVTARRDARNVVTTYGYDALNRPTIVRYTDGTKDVDRHYDNATAGKNGLGRFYYANWDASNNSRFDSYQAVDSYDPMGRPRNYRQRFLISGTATADFEVKRTYDLAGHVLMQTYPSGRKVNYEYDAAGRTNKFTGTIGDGFERTYASAVSYSEFGGMQQEQFGTTTALYHKLHYNQRGQLYDIRLSTASMASDQWNWNRGAILNYYSSNYSWGGNSSGSGSDNNGDLLRTTHYAPLDDQLNQYHAVTSNYSYDKLNRLNSAIEYPTADGSGTASYTQAFTYDRWGNRTIDQSTTSSSVPHPSYTVDTSTNRLVAPSGYAYGYDAAGNQTTDNYTGGGERSFDAENHMTQARNLDSTWSNYTYDLNGRRIKRNINGVETWQLYGMDGELLAEYAANAAPGIPQREYGYRNGELLITAESGVALGVAPESLSAAYASSTMNLNWGATSGAARYRIEKKERNGDFAYLTYSTTNSAQLSVASDTAYLYRVCTADTSNNCTSSYSNIVLGVSVSFAEAIVGTSEDPLNATTIKASHITELRNAINAVRYLAVLNNASYTHSTLTAGSSIIYVEDVRELRDALDEALNVLHLDTRDYTDPDLVGVHENATHATPVKALHIRELRERLVGTLGSSCYKSIEQFVKDFYQGVLQRQPTPSELASATSTLASAQASGTSALVTAAQSLGTTLFGSSEYASRNTSDSQFITDLYTGFLQRQPDSAGHQWWLDDLQGHHAPYQVRPRSELITAFKTSGEFTDTDVKALCRTAGGGSATGSVHWLIADQLGTPRMVVDASGNLANMSRHDYLPFGEDVPLTLGGRNGDQGYSNSDGCRKKFTGYEYDDAADLNFAQARYQSSKQGRFTSVDPLASSATVSDPQSLNLFSYVQNRPTIAVDPSGTSLADIGVLQTEDAEDAKIEEHASLRRLQMSVDDAFAARNGGTMAYGSRTATFSRVAPGIVIATVTIRGPFTDAAGNPDISAMRSALWAYAASGPHRVFTFGAVASAARTSKTANDPPTRKGGYIDINVSYGTQYFVGPTGGVMIDEDGTVAPYIGIGIMNPLGSWSVFHSTDSISGGLNYQIQGGYVLGGALSWDEAGNLSHEFGGSSPGFSLSGYYVFNAPHPYVPRTPKVKNAAVNGNGPVKNSGKNCSCNR